MNSCLHSWLGRCLLAGATLLATQGSLSCSKKSKEAGVQDSAKSAATVQNAGPSTNAEGNDDFWPVPGGPVLAVQAGKGVGPILFGANIQSVERLMGERCDAKDPSRCQFYARAVEFKFQDGTTSTIRIHRAGRLAAKGPKGDDIRWGEFNGAIPPDAQLGMLQTAVEAAIGKPQAKRPVTDARGHGTVFITEYEGMTLEYDKLPNGNVVLGGIVLEAPPKSPAAPPSK